MTMYRSLALMRDAAVSQNKAATEPNQGGDRHKPSHEITLLFLEFSGSFFGETFLLADGRAKGSKNVLLDFSDGRLTVRCSRSVLLKRAAWRVDNLVEIVRQPILVVSQRFKACHRALKLADFARNNGMFQRFGGFCRLRTKLLCRRHWMFCLRFAHAGRPSARRERAG